MNSINLIVKAVVDESRENLLILKDGEGNLQYYICNIFEPSKSSGNEPVEFNLVKGIDITDFVKINQIINQKEWLNRLYKQIEEEKLIVATIKFSTNCQWWLYLSK